MVNRLKESGRRSKESLRSLLLRYNNPLNHLNKIITRIESLEDGSLLVELDSGVKFYAQPDGSQDRMTDFLIRYRKNHLLAQIKGADYFGVFWRELMEQYLDDAYQRYYKIKRGDVVVDLGAHIGTFAVRAAKAVGNEGKVIAVEPGIDNLSFLERNVAANELANVIIVPKAVWSKQGRLKLFIDPTHQSRHSLLWEKNTFSEVEVDTLDNILSELGIKEVDFIKMDIEGAEIEALKGMTEAFKNDNIKLAIAAYHFFGGKPSYTTVIPWLSKIGFEVQFKKKEYVYAQKRINI
jgi:FkbM family methyltransferase